MAAIAVAPFVLKDMIFSVGTDSYESNVSSVLFTPTTSLLTWQGGTPAASYTDQTSPTWTADVAYAQDWMTANSFAQYLLANVGLQKAVVFKPQGTATGRPSFAATVIITPGPIGGDVNTILAGTVKLGVVGQPTKTANP